jgi:hypothetical protein
MAAVVQLLYGTLTWLRQAVVASKVGPRPAVG